MIQILPPLELLACPLCTMPFTQQQTMLRCPRGHTFDIAHEGYVNVVRKRLPGDTREMVHARRSFFAQGYYLPLSDMLNKQVVTYMPTPEPDPVAVLDAGCGEGYYSERLQDYWRALASSNSMLTCGCDISKDAIRLAAKQYPATFFLVANLRERLPFKDSAFSVLLNIFAPRNIEEFARVLGPEGLCIVVIPGVNHLQSLRDTLQLLSIEENKQQHVVEQFSPYFTLLATHSLTYDLQLQREEIVLLVMMTPNYWHLSAEQRISMEQMAALTTTVDFTCLIFRKLRG